MKFYNREDELATLKRAEKLKTKQAIMTMLIGGATQKKPK